MKRKYKLTDETINVMGRTIYRIEALRDFNGVKKGDKGGFIENEDNLSHDGNCWVYGNAIVYNNAKVSSNAKVYGNAKIFCCAEIYDDAIVHGYTKVYGNAKVFEDAKVCGNAKVYGDAEVYGNAKVFGDAKVCSNAKVYGNVKVYGDAEVFGHANVYNNANVYDYAKVYGKAEVCGDATITSNSGYIIFKNWWSSGRFFTWTRSNNMWKVGCFYGSGRELIEKAYKDSELSGREYKRVVDYVESMLKEMLNNRLIKEQNIRKDNGFENIEKE